MKIRINYYLTLSPWRLCVYIVDSEHFERSPSAKKIQVSLSSWLFSIKRSEKGDRVQFVLQHHSPDITGMRKNPRMRRKTKLEIASLSKQSDARWSWCAFLCNLRHLNLTFFKQKPLILRYFYDVMAHWSLFYQKKNIPKNPLSPIRSIFQGNYAMTFLS